MRAVDSKSGPVFYVQSKVFLKFSYLCDVYGHFHIQTQSNNLLSPSWKEKSLQKYNFKENTYELLMAI